MVEYLDSIGLLFENIQQPLVFGGRVAEQLGCIGLMFEHIQKPWVSGRSNGRKA